MVPIRIITTLVLIMPLISMTVIRYRISHVPQKFWLGAIAQSVAMSLGNQEAPQSILASSTSFREDFGHENISTAILSLPLIQEEHLSVNGKKMCTLYW